MRKPLYKVVNFIDVNDLLSFAKKEYKELDRQIKEEERVEKELKNFIIDVEKHSGHKIHHIGHEKRYGRHLIRFIFKDGGFLEVVVEKPLMINGHFINQKSAKRFSIGLKKALHKVLPESPIKAMYIDSVKIEDGFKEELQTLEKWGIMHAVGAIHRTLTISIFAVAIFIMLEASKDIFREKAIGFFSAHSLIISVTIALILAFVFEPIKNKLEQITSKLILK